MNKAKYLILLTVIVTFLTRAGTIMIQTNGPVVARQIFNVPVTRVGLLSVAFGITPLLCRYLVAARVPVPAVLKAIWAGVAILLLSLVASYFSPNFLIFLSATTLAGFGSALIVSLTVSVMNLASKIEELEANLSLYSVGLSLGLIGGPLMGEAIVRNFGLKATYLFLSGLLFIALILVTISLGLSREGLKKRRTPINRTAGYAKKNIYSIFKNETFLSTFIGMLSFGLSFALILTYGGVYAQEQFGLTPAMLQTVFFSFFGISMAVRISLTIFAKTGHFIARDRWFKIGLWLNVAGLIIMGLANHIELFMVGFLLLAMPHAIIMPLSLIRIARSIDSTTLITANTVLLSAFDVGSIIAPSIATILIPFVHVKGVWLSASIIPLFAVYYLRIDKGS